VKVGCWLRRRKETDGMHVHKRTEHPLELQVTFLAGEALVFQVKMQPQPPLHSLHTSTRYTSKSGIPNPRPSSGVQPLQSHTTTYHHKRNKYAKHLQIVQDPTTLPFLTSRSSTLPPPPTSSTLPPPFSASSTLAPPHYILTYFHPLMPSPHYS